MLRLHSGGADFPLLGEFLFRTFQFYLREQNFVEKIIPFFFVNCAALAYRTGYYSIFTVWLQCPLLLLGRYCRLKSFLQVHFVINTQYIFSIFSSVWYAGVGVC